MIEAPAAIQFNSMRILNPATRCDKNEDYCKRRQRIPWYNPKTVTIAGMAISHQHLRHVGAFSSSMLLGSVLCVRRVLLVSFLACGRSGGRAGARADFSAFSHF